MTKILDTVGTLQLIDTGRRCSVRDVRILRVHCTAGCGDDLLHEAIVSPYWSTVKMLNGYHQGCDPDSSWMKDPAGSKLQHDTMKSLLDRRPSGACIACNQLDCTGADGAQVVDPSKAGDPP
jgi:hypothetical protein